MSKIVKYRINGLEKKILTIAERKRKIFLRKNKKSKRLKHIIFNSLVVK